MVKSEEAKFVVFFTENLKDSWWGKFSMNLSTPILDFPYLTTSESNKST